MKCQACKEQEAAWAWQPFGPDEKPDCYTLLGSHYRGFPVIKVCNSCKSAFETGDFPVTFAYKGRRFIGKEHEVHEVSPLLWVGETYKPSELNSAPARAIMRDTPKGIDVAALVYEDNSDLLPAFLSAPALVEACQELERLRYKIEFYLQRGLEAGRIDEGYYRQIMLALANIHVALQSQEKGA